ncbi:MAG: nucleotidyltransferase domain-containing protein [bacterium]
MRLTKQEVEAIITGINLFVVDTTAELRLFGSRVDSQAKGGDIDLLLIMGDKAAKISLLQQKPEILVAIGDILGERRIDLKIACKDELQKDHFLRIIYPQSVFLHSF